jgi:uncharacterized membrane protein YkvA (DUF1232 family)
VDLSWLIAIVIGLVALWVVLLVVLWLARPKGIAAGELLRLVPDTLRLIRGLIADGSVPLDVRAVLVGLLLWLISPIDLIPDFIPVLGTLDDVVVSIVALRYARRRLGLDELHRRWAGTEAGFDTLTRIVGTSAG